MGSISYHITSLIINSLRGGHTCAHAHTHLHTDTCAHTCIYTNTYTHVSIQTHECMNTCIPTYHWQKQFWETSHVPATGHAWFNNQYATCIYLHHNKCMLQNLSHLLYRFITFFHTGIASTENADFWMFTWLVVLKPGPIMLSFLTVIMLLSNAQKVFLSCSILCPWLLQICHSLNMILLFLMTRLTYTQ